ncbi:MAG: M20/M25/M40 family metallo-hydrolase [Acidobacteriota bacterium]
MRSTHTPSEIFDTTLDFLERFSAISSPSGDLAGLNAAADCLAAPLRRHRFEVEVARETGADGIDLPVLYARAPGEAADEGCLLLIGHIDTVLPAATPERRDGRLYATGAIDMKGGLAALIGALDLLQLRGLEPPRDLLLAVVPDEEVAGHLSQQVVARLGAKARGLWVLEPGTPRGTADGRAVETLVTGRRGMFDWHLKVRGRSAHAGNAYWEGRSAVSAAAAWCAEARRLVLEGRATRGEATSTINAGRMVGGEAGFLEDLRAGAELVGTTRQVNVVPDAAAVDGEARFLGHAEGAALRQTLHDLTTRLAEEHDLEMDFLPGPEVPPVDPTGPSREQSRLAVELARKAGWTIELEEDRGGISFSNFLPDPSAIPILDGLGPVGDGMHTRDEYVELPSLDRRIALLADLLELEAKQG